MSRLFTISKDALQASVTKTENFTQTTGLQNSATARALEFWLNVTAFSGFTSIDIAIDATLDGTNFSQIGLISGVTGVTGVNGAKTIVVNRADNALGVQVRFRLVVVGGPGSVTFDILMGRME